jgi:hypothetical protein
LDQKFADQVKRLDQVQMKVDLSMTSLSAVQQEQLHVVKALKSTATPSLTILAVGDGISTFDYLSAASYGPCAAGALA